jgi:hypothetical protein
MSNIVLNDIPMRTIGAKSGAELWLEFNSRCMTEAGHFKSKRLPSSPRTQFKHGIVHFLSLSSYLKKAHETKLISDFRLLCIIPISAAPARWSPGTV